jgi:hypothetical protein
MKRLLLILAFLVPSMCYAQGQWGTLPVDLVIPMNTSTPGTTLTTAIANAGMVSNNCVPGGAGSTGCNFSAFVPNQAVGANQNACSNFGAVTVNSGSQNFPAQSLNYNSIAVPDVSFQTSPPQIGNITFNSGIRPSSVTALYCLTLGMPGQNNGNDYDTLWLQDGNGHGSIVQIGNGSGGGSGLMAVSIEANSPFAHSSAIRIQPYDGNPRDSTYWFSLNVVGGTAPGSCTPGATGCSTLTVWNSYGAQLGQVTVPSTFSTLTNIRLPSNENGTDANTTYYQNVMVNWTAPPVAMFWNQTDTTAGILSPPRSADWSLAGVTGGIPTGRTQCVTTNCAALNSSSTASQIQTAFAGAPANSYVLLPAATYPFCLSLSGTSNVTLRGAGANNTIFSPTSTCGGAGINVTNSGGTNEGSPATVSGVTVQGTNTLTLSSVSGLAVGDTIVVDQHDSTSDLGGLLILGSPSSYTGPFAPPGNAGPYSQDGETQNARCPGGSSAPATCFHQEHIAVVTGISGSNVTISPPLAMPNWSPSLTMSAWWASTPISGVGIEDLQVNMTGASGGDGIYLTWCANCWTKGVSIVDTNLAHVQMNYSTNDTINNSYFFLTQNHTTSSYGTVCNSCSHALIENNIFHAVASPVIWNGTSSGNVVGYNFNINDYYTSSTGYSQNFIGEHSGGVDTNLYEGNFTTNWAAADTIHGTGNLDTFFRNYISGTPPACYASGSTYATSTYAACNNPLVPFQIQSYHRFYNVIGNVLGTTGQNTVYLANQSFSNSDVYSVGLGGSAANDPNVNSTLMLWGNCDSATGFTACRFNANEINAGTAFISLPTSQQVGYNPTPASHTLPASFYYSSKPSWWPSAKPWPIIGPDISGGNISGVNGLVYTNPAADCYTTLGGLANGTGSQLTFSEATCYGAPITGNVTVTPSSNNFGSFNVGFPSSIATFTVTSTLSASTSLSFAFLGGNTGDFASTGAGTCGASLGAGASCTYIVKFTPSAAGVRTTTLTVVDTAGTQTSALTGIGLPVPKFNYAADDYGGLLSVQCSPNPHAVTITSASQSGTVQTVIVSSVSNFAVNEAMLISGTGTAMDWTYTPNSATDGASYITAINSGTKTLTLTAVASHTVGTVTVGKVTPGRYYIQTINTPFGSGPQFCDPEQRWQWFTVVGAAGGQTYQTSSQPACGNSCGITINLSTKYGSYCNATQALQAEFVNTLNFNGIGPDPDSTYLLAGNCTTNTKLSTFTDNNVSTYAAVNLGGYISQPLMDLNADVDNFYNANNGVNAPLPDYFNANWETFIQGLILNFNSAITNGNYRSPKFMGGPGDDTDFTKLPDAGDHFHTIPIGHQSVDPALQVMVTSPLMTLEAVPIGDIYLNGAPTPYVFANPLNYSKTPMASPPGSCAVATICDLFDFLSKEYTTTAALNTAWSTSSFYTTFGSSGTCYGYSYSWCGATSGAGSFAGTGATTYTPTLNSPTSPHSVQILLNGVAIGGDCPFFSAVLQTGCTGTAGTGNILGPGVWKALLAVPLDFVRTDSNGNIEEYTTAGTTGASVPSWPGTCTGSQTTTDGTAVATCLGPGISNTSTITYSTGVTSIVFNSALSGSYTVTLNYMKNGWTQGTGVMDEDGRNTTWIGTNYVCLVQPPAFANNTNYALNQIIYDNPSGSWQIVTVAGNSVGSTPSFSAGQGAATVAGGATFQSLGLPVCGVEAGSDWGPINANQTFAADMATWLAQESGAYFSGIQTAYHTAYPDLLYGSADSVGVYSDPPRAGVLQGAQQYSDWMYTGSFVAPNLDPNALAKYSFQSEYYQRPMITYHALASTQSLYGCDGNPLCFSTQLLKGQQYFLNTQAQLTNLSYSGTLQWAGMQWWGSHPFQTSDFGFNTSLDNLYDGNDNVTASVPCSIPLAVYTCGSETSGSWNGVTLVSQIASANLLWTQGSVPTPPVLSPCLKCFVEEKPDETVPYLYSNGFNADFLRREP